ncbi:MAG: hypothetical protein M9894_19970 [Planctomycetes bacterium]|nr:hypothetical protein [Planctomycetota bacterium]
MTDDPTTPQAQVPPPAPPAQAASTPSDAGPAEHELDPIDAMRARGKHPELAALLAWLVPGAGHVYAGQRIKGLVSMVLLLGAFAAGLRVSRGEAVSLEAEMGHRFAFIAQVGAGLPTAAGLAYSHGHLPWTPDRSEVYWAEAEYVSRLPAIDTGLLLTMVAGLLNLLLIHDALNGMPGAQQRRAEEARHRARLERLRKELEAGAQAPDGGVPS